MIGGNNAIQKIVQQPKYYLSNVLIGGAVQAESTATKLYGTFYVNQPATHDGKSPAVLAVRARNTFSTSLTDALIVEAMIVREIYVEIPELHQYSDFDGLYEIHAEHDKDGEIYNSENRLMWKHQNEDMYIYYREGNWIIGYFNKFVENKFNDIMVHTSKYYIPLHIIYPYIRVPGKLIKSMILKL